MKRIMQLALLFLFVVLVLTFCDSSNILGTAQLPYIPGTFTEEDLGYVKAGSFTMGHADIDGSGTNEIAGTPTHTVTITYDYYVSKYEITEKQFKSFDLNKAYVEGEGFPVTEITWDQAIQFCNWASRQNNLPDAYNADGTLVDTIDKVRGFRLPTEAEWEYAARNEGQRPGNEYSGGDDTNLDDISWYYQSPKRLQRTGQKLPNEKGLYDMTGNASELIYDYMYNYTAASVVNPVGPIDDPTYTFARGGNYEDTNLSQYRTSQRRYTEKSGSIYVGFRIVRTILD